MPEHDPSLPSEPSEPAGEVRNLPAPVPQPAANRPGDHWLTWALRTIFGWNGSSIRANLTNLLQAGAAGSGFSPKESVLLQNILGLRARRVVDVMVPRADIIAVPQDIALGELMKVFANAGHSRLVVYAETLDDAIGMVHIRDLIAFMTRRAESPGAAPARRKKPLAAGLDLKAVDLSMPLSAAKFIRDMLFVPPSMPAMDLLARMQASRIHLALVVDEYGGADGVVSIEDIVEEIVGEIEDEHDDAVEPKVVRQADGSYVADARARLEDVTAMLGPTFDVGAIANEVDTLAGYIATRIGRVPVRGELVPGPGPFEIEVLDADPRRVKKLRIYRAAEGRNSRGAVALRRPPDAAAAQGGATSVAPEASEASPKGTGDSQAPRPS